MLTLKQLDETAKQLQSAKGRRPFSLMASKNDSTDLTKHLSKQQNSIDQLVSAYPNFGQIRPEGYGLLRASQTMAVPTRLENV